MQQKVVLSILDKQYVEMKLNYNAFLNNPKEKTEDEMLSINAIGDNINRKLSFSHELKKYTTEVFVSLFFGKDKMPDDFQELSNKIYFKDTTSIESIDWVAFISTVKSGLSRLIIPDSIERIAIVFSLSKLREEDVFALNREEDKVKVTYQAQKPNYCLEDVVMNDDEKKALLRALTIITHQDLIFNKWGYHKVDRSTKSVICFHGAAGTGKTMCAHAVADYLGKKIIIGSYSKIQSKFVGEGEKNLVAYFNAAEEQDAVLFIDEADTFLSKRLPSSNENSKHYNSMSNELYQLIENFNGCIVFASNHIKDFDPAVISRIIEPIEFKLPDKATRIKIIKKLLPPTVPIELSDNDFVKLSILTEGFSGRDIRKGMLIFVAESAFNHCVIGRENPDEVKLVYAEIEKAFKSVRKSKENLDKGVAGFSIVNRVSEETKKNTRLLQVAALTLWADGVPEEKEKKLFGELCAQMGTTVDLNNRDALPNIEKICSSVITKQEKVQMLDIACRMAAIDNKFPFEEMQFVSNLAVLLGFSEMGVEKINEYVDKLISENCQWSEITANIQCSESDIIKILCHEYSEASAWNKLGLAYIEGGQVAGVCVAQNKNRAKACLEKAKDKGYKLNEVGEKFLMFN